MSATLSYKHFAFPLNVYAHAQQLQEGRAEYLHYGLFRDGQTSLVEAQRYSTELLLSRLPAPPCRILEVGIGLGTTYSLLTEKGYQVHGITPDARQIAHIRERLGDQVAVACQRLEAFEAEAESFDVVLFQESAQYIEPLAIFNRALDLLAPSGSLLIIDEFALRRTDPGVESLHRLDDMVALAGRFGFDLVERLDLSMLAVPTLDYLLRVTALHRQKLMEDLGLTPQTLEELDASNRAYREKYVSGRYGYALLHFRKRSSPRWRLRLVEETRVDEVLTLFERVFGHRLEPAMWQWKYGQGRGREVGVWQEGRMVAHYGGMGRDILFFGQPQSAVQVGDVMVDAAERGVLTRSGPFFLMAATFLEQYIGYGKPYLVGFGFPQERAMKVAERLGLYTEVGRMVELAWPPLAARPQWWTRLCPVGTGDDWAAIEVDALWQRMAENLRAAVVGVRDWRYLCQRYLAHPHQRYQVLLIKNRFGGRARGVLVLRRDPGNCELVDFVGQLEEIPLLIMHARRLAAINSDPRLFCRITENFAPLFAATGGVLQELDIRIPANAWSDGPTPESLCNHWWLMSGDTDFR